VPETGRTSWIIFAALNDACSPQDSCTKPKLICLKLPGYWDSENVRKMSSMPVIKTTMQNVHTLFESLCDERSLCELSGVLAGETSSRAPIKGTGNYCLKIMITI
jgi:hypothetical protein